jgi:hypothetical protein
MNYNKKQQPNADKTLRKDPTIVSASPSGSGAHTAHWGSRVFSVGDLIVEDMGYGSLRFGIILSIHRDKTISVHYPDGVDYSFIGYCLPYDEWLRTVSLGDT